MDRQPSHDQLVGWEIWLRPSREFIWLSSFSIYEAVGLFKRQHLSLTREQRDALDECDTEAAWDEFDWSPNQRAAIKTHLDKGATETADVRSQAEKLVALLRDLGIASFACVLNESEAASEGSGYVARVVVITTADASEAVNTIFPHQEDDERAGFETSRYPNAEGLVAALSNGDSTPREWLPRDGEAPADYMRRVAVDSKRLISAARIWRQFGGDISNVAAYFAQQKGAADAIEWVWDGLIPRGMVSIVIGEPKIGKSTLAFQIALSVAKGEPIFGRQTVQGGGTVIYVSGEDPWSIVIGRANKMVGGNFDHDACAPGMIFVECVLGPFNSILAKYDHANSKTDLVIVDTASRFIGLEGSTSDTGHVRRFLTHLEEFAKRRNAAVLVIHHVNKRKPDKGRPQTANDIVLHVNGAGDFISAPRFGLTFFEPKKDSKIRVLQYGFGNMPVGTPLCDEPIRLSFDNSTGLHSVATELPPVGAARQERQAASEAAPNREGDVDADARTAAAVINRALAEGRALTRAGAKEPYNLRAPELAGWPRSRVRRAHARAVELNLVSGTGGEGSGGPAAQPPTTPAAEAAE